MWGKLSGEKVQRHESSPERIATQMFGCSQENYRSLKERILQSDGKIHVFVHPFYLHDNQEPDTKRARESGELAHITEKLEEFFSKIQHSHTPVIVFQEKKHLPRRDLYLLGDPKQNIFFVPTRENDPRPVFDIFSGNKFVRDGGWKDAINVFKDLKVQNIALSGLYLWNHPLASDDSYSGCVGATYRNLKKDFSVEISDMTYPDRKIRPKHADAS